MSPFYGSSGQKLLESYRSACDCFHFCSVLVCVKGPKGKLSGPVPALPRPLRLTPGDSVLFFHSLWCYVADEDELGTQSQLNTHVGPQCVNLWRKICTSLFLLWYILPVVNCTHLQLSQLETSTTIKSQHILITPTKASLWSFVVHPYFCPQFQATSDLVFVTIGIF